MTEMLEGSVNGRWPLVMPDFRVAFHAARERWEAGRLEHMHDRVEPGMTIFDVGAECGDFTALMRSWTGDTGIVVPFEPKIESWPSIQATWSANFAGPPAASFVGFASNITQPLPGQNAIRWSDHAWPSEASGLVVNDPGFHHLAQEGAHIQQCRLDEFATMTGNVPDVVTVDVEGAEWDVLRGLGLFIEAGHRPIVYVSVHQVNNQPGSLASWYGKTLLDLRDLMERLFGYGPGIELEANGEGETFWVWPV